MALGEPKRASAPGACERLRWSITSLTTAAAAEAACLSDPASVWMPTHVFIFNFCPVGAALARRLQAHAASPAATGPPTARRDRLLNGTRTAPVVTRGWGAGTAAHCIFVTNTY